MRIGMLKRESSASARALTALLGFFSSSHKSVIICFNTSLEGSSSEIEADATSRLWNFRLFQIHFASKGSECIRRYRRRSPILIQEISDKFVQRAYPRPILQYDVIPGRHYILRKLLCPRQPSLPKLQETATDGCCLSAIPLSFPAR